MKLIFALLAAACIPSAAVPFTDNSAMNDYNLSFDETERMMVFARSEADFRIARIFVAERIVEDWH